MTDETLHGVVDVEHVETHIAHVVAIDELGVGIVVVGEGVQPVGRGRRVAPLHVHEVFQSQVVTSTEERHRQTVALTQTEIEPQVDIIEVHGVVLIILRGLQEQVEIGAATCKEEGGGGIIHRLTIGRLLILELQRAFGIDLSREQTDGAAIMIAVQIARTGVDIKNRRGATTQLGGHQSFIE